MVMDVAVMTAKMWPDLATRSDKIGPDMADMGTPGDDAGEDAGDDAGDDAWPGSSSRFLSFRSTSSDSTGLMPGVRGVAGVIGVGGLRTSGSSVAGPGLALARPSWETTKLK